MTLSSIKRLHNVIEQSLFMTTGKLDYDRVTDALITLSNAVYTYDGDNEDWFYIGELSNCSLADLIPGAYWHYTEWHSGQWSKGYAALSALGQVFRPGMTSLEPDTAEYDVYNALDLMASGSQEISA